jgi:hypothetical protein
MRADASEHLCVEPAGVGLGEFDHLGAEGAFAVPAGQIAMNLGEVIPLLQFGRESPQMMQALRGAADSGCPPALSICRCRAR